MLNKVATRIQTRLSRKGLKIILGDIKEYLKVNVLDIENITKEEENSTTEYFLSSATKLAVAEELKPMQQFDDVTADIDSINTESIQNIDDQDDSAIAPEPDPAPLAITNKSELVTATASQMGIVLNTQEISLIAENIHHSSDDFDQDIDAIKAAIMAFINHKSLINQSKINELIHEVREVVGAKNSENSQLLSEGLKQINSDIQEANRAFKSNVRTALSAFDIPALKAS